jgi:hypothetical protein
LKGWPSIRNILLKSGLVALLVGIWLFFYPAEYAHATDGVQSEQVNVSTPTSLETATATIQAAETTITNLETATAQIQTVLSVVQQPSETLTATVQQANTALQTANTALDSATAKVETATATLISAGLETATATTIASNLAIQETVTAQAQTTYTENKAISDAANTNQTVTETFNNNTITTDMVITVGATPVSTSNNGGVYVSTNYAGAYGMVGSNMTLMNPSSPVTIDLPSNKTITEFGFTSGAKNGTVNATVTYTDGTTTTMQIVDNCNDNYPGFTNVNSTTATSGKIIDKVVIPVDGDYYLIDNLYYKVVTSDPTKTATTAASLQILTQEQYELMVLQGAQTKLTEANTAATTLKTATDIAENKVVQAKIAAVTAALPAVDDKLDSVALNTSYLISVSDTATAAIVSAQGKLTLAQSALDSATAAMNTAITLKSDAQTVEAATALVAQRQAEFNAAKAVVDSNTQSGLRVDTYYYNGGASPAMPSADATPVTTFIDSNGIDEQWGGGEVANSGRSERVIVKYSGAWIPQTTGTQYITAPADDGTKLYLDGQLVINDWYDKGGGGSTADVDTISGVSKEFEFWYYENGGGAAVSLKRYTDSGDWEAISGNEFVRSTATTQQRSTLASATTNLSSAQTTLQTAQIAENAMNTAEALVQTAVTKTIEAITATNTADSLVDAEMIIAPPRNLSVTTANNGNVTLAWEAPTTGVEPERYAIFFDNNTTAGWGIATGNAGDENALNTTVTLSIEMFESTGGLDSTYDFSVRSDQDSLQMYSSMSNTVSTEIIDLERVAAEAEALRQATLAAEASRQAAIAEENARVASENARAAEAAASQAEAAAKAAQAEAAKAEADRVAAEEAAAQAEAEAQQAEEDRIAAEEAAAQAEEEAKAAEEAEAKAEAERLEAEAEEARQAEENAKAEAEAAEAEAEAARQAEEDAKAEAEAKEKELEEAKAEEAAQEKEEELKEILEEAKDGKELTEEQKEVLVEALIENLKPGESVSAAEVKASGVSYADLPPSTPVEIRTDESGNPLVITAEVAANIELVQDPGALLSAAFNDPGAALEALGSIGADMTDEEREEATDMVVATVVAAGAAINAAAVAAGGATGGSTGGGGSSGGGGSGANSPGSRGGRKW